MNIRETLRQLAQDFGLDAAALLGYASEDPHPTMGWDAGAGLAPCGAIWSVEGQILYALVRLLRPALIVEVGSFTGASSTHMAAALKKNRKGRIISIDLAPGVGFMLPADLRKYVEYVNGEGAATISGMNDRIDFLFEDALHDRPGTAAIVRAAREKMDAGAFGVSHDASHFLVGADVRGGLEDAGANALVYLTEPSDCGLGVWRK